MAASKMGANAYGKEGIRLVRVVREADADQLYDLTLRARLEGDFARVYEAGDNSPVLPTDTMRSTVYALAKKAWDPVIETFAATIAHRLLEASPAAYSACVEIEAHAWARIHPHAFAGAGSERSTARVTAGREALAVTSGIAGLRLLKTAHSGFAGFLEDEYTVLPATADRLLASEVTVAWEYGSPEVAFGPCRAGARAALLNAFAAHESLSVQHTLHAMGDAVLRARPEITRAHLAMPNLHHVAVDLAAFGLANPNEVFVATDRPFGVIEGTVERG